MTNIINHLLYINIDNSTIKLMKYCVTNGREVPAVYYDKQDAIDNCPSDERVIPITDRAYEVLLRSNERNQAGLETSEHLEQT